MWSDTGSNQFDSKGDLKSSLNLDKYNIEPHLTIGIGANLK